MTTHLLKLFTHPGDAWIDIRHEEEQHPRHYLPHLLVFALIPALCLFIGTTRFGWSLAGTERVRLSVGSAAELGILLYLTMLLGVAVMGGFIRWMSRTFDTRPSLEQCIGFAAYGATPYFVAGIAGLYPGRWLALIALLAASAYATFLLFIGLPTFLRLRKEQGLLYSTSVWAVGLLVLVTILVSMILFWFDVLGPEYMRPAALG
ncbi:MULTISPECIES: Yip1 family protein [Pseudomonas]|uniref:Yip1 family protein n=1 Tax=Pseudomonas TaxID=286 RepID=UPI00040055BE|nr:MULTISPECIES: Yip1 family protein [Pseudomonas]MCW2271202.1 hypothetical protein [Pseudomonas sp. JUb96]PRA58144.1 YIP1 family protein [Pseudomonas sp. MYb187]